MPQEAGLLLRNLHSLTIIQIIEFKFISSKPLHPGNGESGAKNRSPSLASRPTESLQSNPNEAEDSKENARSPKVAGRLVWGSGGPFPNGRLMLVVSARTWKVCAPSAYRFGFTSSLLGEDH